MEKYNLNYTKITELEQENARLKEQNAEICKRLEELERLISNNRQLSKKTLVGALERDKYLYLFGMEIGLNGKINATSSGSAAADLFTPFQANIMRTICPRSYMPPNSIAGKYRIIGKKLEDLTDEQFLIVVETFQSIIDTLAYAKRKISEGDKNV